MYVHGIRKLFRFGGYVLGNVSMTTDLAQVNLRRDRRCRLRCPACRGTMPPTAPGFPPPASRTACLTIVFKLAQSAQRSWRKLKGSVLPPEVIRGLKFVEGVRPDADDAAV